MVKYEWRNGNREIRLSEDPAGLGLADGAAKLGGGFNPFIDNHFDVGMGLAVSG
jgi:hypothetical protein